MILQAVPFFHRRFQEDAWILRYFQAFYLVFFAFTMLSVTVFLAAQHSRPSYTRRLSAALITYVTVATLLMISTFSIFNVSAKIYFIFALVMVTITAIANGLSQNAAFAFAAGFGRTEYAPAIMTGEALAGLLPSTIGAIVFRAQFLSFQLTWQRNCVRISLSCHVLRRRRH
jgi:equilibrative nucleoside transporter 1/2/3